MHAHQLDLLQLKSKCPRRPQRLAGNARARYWFHEMRRTVDAARAWVPVPSQGRETPAENQAAA